MTAPQPPRERLLALVAQAVGAGTLVKLTLGKYRGADPTLRNLFVRPVALQAGPHLAFLWRHATRDITKNHAPADALAQLAALIGGDFLDAHLFTTTEHAQLETTADGGARLKISPPAAAGAALRPPRHDEKKAHPIPADAPWLRALGVTNDRGRPREGMADKFRQIQKFAELLAHLIAEAFPPAAALGPEPLRVADMGAGKGYLTFAAAALLGPRARIQGIEARTELVELCNRVARENAFTNLTFTSGQIDSAVIGAREAAAAPGLDVLIALHACDTATDDALARGIAAGARLLVVAPCCQRELRPQLIAPPVLAGALRHGIFQERQAEFVTDALRALLLEWAGYRTKVFEFVSTEHTAKNLMIAAIKAQGETTAALDAAAERVRAFAQFYGIRRQRLAARLNLPLSPGT